MFSLFKILLYVVSLLIITTESKSHKGPVCELKPESGLCRGSFQRYFYNPLTNECEKFTYGGCGGNRNNFEEYHKCVKKCKKIVKQVIIERQTIREPTIINYDPHMNHDPRINQDPRMNHDPRMNIDPRMIHDPRMNNIDPRMNNIDPRMINDPRMMNDPRMVQFLRNQQNQRLLYNQQHGIPSSNVHLPNVHLPNVNLSYHYNNPALSNINNNHPQILPNQLYNPNLINQLPHQPNDNNSKTITKIEVKLTDQNNDKHHNKHHDRMQGDDPHHHKRHHGHRNSGVLIKFNPIIIGISILATIYYTFM